MDQTTGEFGGDAAVNPTFPLSIKIGESEQCRKRRVEGREVGPAGAGIIRLVAKIAFGRLQILRRFGQVYLPHDRDVDRISREIGFGEENAISVPISIPPENLDEGFTECIADETAACRFPHYLEDSAMERTEISPKEPHGNQDARILLVDDQPANLDVLCRLLEANGYKIMLAPSGAVALKSAERAMPDLILLDVMMPEMDGFEVCRRLKADEKTREIPVIFITARDVHEDVVAGFEIGAVDYIAKPFNEREVLVRVQTHVRLNRLTQELVQKNRELEEEISQRKALKGQLSMISERETERWGLEGFVGQSPTLQRIFSDIRLLQESVATSVLIAGESGTGKELIARAIHFGSPRKDGPFVPVNCAAMPADLVESLLFGHARGAFTGADDDRIGYFEMAHAGTLFLDEIGDMPLDLQAKLLRVLEDGEVRRVGETTDRKVDVRVLAATNADLPERIQGGRFRQDLYFRLARFTVTAPPLRERREDIPLLAQHFLQLFAGEMGRTPPPLSPQVLESLSEYDFPGNVRELKNIIERALIESRGGEIQSHQLHFAPQTEAAPSMHASESPIPDLPMDLERAAAQAELWVVRRAIDRADGNISEAARLLGTNRNKIYRVLGQENC